MVCADLSKSLDENKSRAQLIQELSAARSRLNELSQEIANLKLRITPAGGLPGDGKATSENEKGFQQLADAMPQLVWTAEPDGRVDYYNIRYKDYPGIEPLADGTYKWSPVLHDEDKASTIEAWQHAVRTGETYQMEHRVKRADGRFHWHLSRGIPVRNHVGKIIKWFGTATDIEIVKQSEKKLQRSSQFPEENPNPVMRCSRDGVIMFANEAARLLLARLGWTGEGPAPGSVQKIVAQDRDPGRTVEAEIIDPLGHAFTIFSVRPHGERYINLYGIDITERKKAAEELQAAKLRAEAGSRRLEAILQTLPVGVIVTDTQGGIILTNNMDEKIWGKRPRTTDVGDYGQYQAWWADSGRPVEPHEWASAQAVLNGRSVFGQVLKIQRFNGSQAYVHNSAVPIRGEAGTIIGSAVAIQDITELRSAQEELRCLNETLEKKVDERTAQAEARAKQLQVLAVELIEAEESERRRISRMLHDDLQQILAAARMQVEIVCEKHPEGPILQSIGPMLSEAINKTRQLSHELSPTVLHHTGLVPALQWLAGQMVEQFGLKVEIIAASETLIEREPLRVFLFRAAHELLFNVFKHSGVKSACVLLSTSQDCLDLTVSDKGRGFDSGNLYSADRPTGFGLLTIIERVRHLGGSFLMDSAPGKGTRFTLRVPIDAVIAEKAKWRVTDHQRSTPSMSSESEGTENIRVLFVDDHEMMRKGLIQLLSGQPDIRVVGEASNGREAIEQVRQIMPDVVVMDVSMPEMNGIEATRCIKAEWPDVRVVGLSMLEDEHLSQQMQMAGAEIFLSKTASSAELLKAIYGMDCKSLQLE